MQDGDAEVDTADEVEKVGDIYDRIVSMVDKPTWKSLLVDTVRSEGLDPWDIDISLLSNRFFEKVKSMRDLNLRVPANAILASSILLRFKSDSWIFFPSAIEDEVEEEKGTGRMEMEVPELPSIRRITKRKVTLDDLIRAIEDVMEKEIRKKSKRERRLIDINPMEVLRESFFDDENIKKHLDSVYVYLNSRKDDNGLVLFSALLKEKTPDDVVKNLIPILHLANEGRISLWQEEFFDEIIIKVNEDGRKESSN